jgi:hypothetical protein
MEDDIGNEVLEDVFEKFDGETKGGPIPTVLQHV